MERSAHAILRYRWWVVVFWIIAMLAGGFAAARVPDRLSADFSVPGQEGSDTQADLARAYGIDGGAASVPVLTAPEGREVERADVDSVATALREQPGRQVLDYGRTGDRRFLTDDGRSTFLLVFAPPGDEGLEAAVTAAARQRGRSNDDAVVTAVATAGRSVLASGLTVAISLLALVVVDVPLVRSMGLGGMLIPLISTLVVLTLLPALLSLAGPRVDRPRLRAEKQASSAWLAWTRGVIRFRWVAAGSSIAALTVAIVPVFGLQIGSSGSDSLASGGAAHDTLRSLRAGGVGNGVLTPMPLLVEPGGDARALADAAASVKGVRMAVVAPPAADGTTAVVVVPDHETVDNTSVSVVTAVREATRDRPGYGGVTGPGAQVIDFQRAVYDKFPYVIALIALVVFVLLVRAFRSLLLPLKAVVLNLASVAATFGIATWFWQDGHGSEAVFGIAASGAMTFWLPVLIFAFLFGLSMDYEVFILDRMREEYERTGSTAYAVEHGLGRTGRLVTSAALILFFAFAALGSAPQTDIKILATALGVGILLDATVVRALLVPAMVSLFGRFNWWLPAGIARLLRVEPSPLKPEVPRK